MQRLILLRHGKADSVSGTGGDLERGLTDRGRRDAALMGRVLAEAGFAPDLVLVSSARRTCETWEEVAPAFPDAKVEFSRGLYLASSDHLAHAVDASSTTADCLMIIGHNPGLHELAIARAGAAALDDIGVLDSFPTSGAAVFSWSEPGGWSLERVMVPRDHGGGAL
jgi:phosphohistidine phosphatase